MKINKHISGFSQLGIGDGSNEWTFHVDDSPQSGHNKPVPTKSLHENQDPICSCTASNNTIIVGRSSGVLLRYNLNPMSLEYKYIVRCRPQKLTLNSNCQRLAIIDVNNVLSLFDLFAKSESGGNGSGKGNGLGQHLAMKKKDCWDIVWSKDNPELFACMEKNKMYIFRGEQPEEPVQSSAYICCFNDLEIKAVQLDEIMMNPDNPEVDHVGGFVVISK